MPIGLTIHRTVILGRPDGDAWSNVDDMLRDVRMELADGVMADGIRYIGAAPLQERRKPPVSSGHDSGNGMGLKLDRTLGTLVLGDEQHGYVFIRAA